MNAQESGDVKDVLSQKERINRSKISYLVNKTEIFSENYFLLKNENYSKKRDKKFTFYASLIAYSYSSFKRPYLLQNLSDIG